MIFCKVRTILNVKMMLLLLYSFYLSIFETFHIIVRSNGRDYYYDGCILPSVY